MKQKTFIKVQFIKEGIHRFPGAAEAPYKTEGDMDVSYLANEHSHYFYFYVTVQVGHDDREIEFLQFRRWLEKQYDSGVISLDYKSCEMMAKDLTQVIINEYGEREMKIEVYEDNINGAVVETTF